MTTASTMPALRRITYRPTAKANSMLLRAQTVIMLKTGRVIGANSIINALIEAAALQPEADIVALTRAHVAKIRHGADSP